MNLSPTLNDHPAVTVTHVLEHLYCPRFTYYEYVLAIPERQERRWKVQKGRQVHLERQKVNRSYLRKKLRVVDRQFDMRFSFVAFLLIRHHRTGNHRSTPTCADSRGQGCSGVGSAASRSRGSRPIRSRISSPLSTVSVIMPPAIGLRRGFSTGCYDSRSRRRM